jgi:hypothetical protein
MPRLWSQAGAVHFALSRKKFSRGGFVSIHRVHEVASIHRIHSLVSFGVSPTDEFFLRHALFSFRVECDDFVS